MGWWSIGQRDDGIQQRSLADYTKKKKKMGKKFMKTYSTFLLYLPSICILKVLMFCIDLDHKSSLQPFFLYLLFLYAFCELLYYITKMLDWLEQITLIYSNMVAKYITSFNLFVIIDICHIIHVITEFDIHKHTIYIHR